eukprot:3803298-Amphidinium_carterae.1
MNDDAELSTIALASRPPQTSPSQRTSSVTKLSLWRGSLICGWGKFLPQQVLTYGRSLTSRPLHPLFCGIHSLISMCLLVLSAALFMLFSVVVGTTRMSAL